MNLEDFRRNFAQSYFAVHASFFRNQFSDDEWANLDLTSKVPVIPCTMPTPVSNSMLGVRGITRIKNNTFGRSFEFRWVKDMDEDSSVMLTKAPRLGMVSAYDTAVFIRRAAVRQYNRGYVPRSCQSYIANPQAYMWKGLGGQPTPSDQEVIWRIYNPLYKEFGEAVDIINRGERIGVPLSRLLAVVVEERRKNPLIVYRDEVIGFCQNGGITLYDSTTDAQRDYVVKTTKAHIKIKS
jgi:hypothetical protein